jgi:hypothetical protein
MYGTAHKAKSKLDLEAERHIKTLKRQKVDRSVKVKVDKGVTPVL